MTAIAATTAALAAGLLAFAGAAHADPIAAIVADRVAPALPVELGVAEVHVPAALARLDVAPGSVAIELPRALRAGRASVKLVLRGRTTWVPVSIAALAEVAVAQRALAPGDVIAAADFAVERRATTTPALAPAALVGATVARAIAAGAPIAGGDVAPLRPLARGAHVTVEVRRGAVHVRGAAVLERAARPGDRATARLVHSRATVHGTLIAPATLLVGDPP